MDDRAFIDGKNWAVEETGNRRSLQLHHLSIPQDRTRLSNETETSFGSAYQTQTPRSVNEQADALERELSELRRLRLLRTDLADRQSESSRYFPAASSMRDHPSYGEILNDTLANQSSLADDFAAARRVRNSNSLNADGLRPTDQSPMGPSLAFMTLHSLQARINQERFLTDMLRAEQERRWLLRRQEQLTMTRVTPKRFPRAEEEDTQPAKKKKTETETFPAKGDHNDHKPSSTRDDSEGTPQGQPRTIPLSIASDKLIVSPYQQLLRDSLEFFVVSQSDQIRNAYGRDYGVKEGQVGIRCRFCAHRAMHWKGRGSLYFPGKVTGVYQAAQNLGINHLLSSCSDIPDDRREKMVRLRKATVRRNGGGKRYWEEGCRSLGLYDCQDKPGVWLR